MNTIIITKSREEFRNMIIAVLRKHNDKIRELPELLTRMNSYSINLLKDKTITIQYVADYREDKDWKFERILSGEVNAKNIYVDNNGIKSENYWVKYQGVNYHLTRYSNEEKTHTFIDFCGYDWEQPQIEEIKEKVKNYKVKNYEDEKSLIKKVKDLQKSLKDLLKYPHTSGISLTLQGIYNEIDSCRNILREVHGNYHD